MLYGVCLHDPQKPAAPTVFPGRLPSRHPHNLGFLWKGAHSYQNSNYKLNILAFHLGDPYQHQVKIPHNARERWGGRKICMHKKRGLTIREVT